MTKSDQINELASALSKAQGAMESAIKDSENPFFKSRYADLAAVYAAAKKPLSDNGLAVTQHPGTDGNIVTVETVLCHLSGQWMASQLTMTAKDASPQAIGSCITYARRYALSSVLGIASEEDDDGNAAQSKGAPAVQPARPTAKPKTPVLATANTRAAFLDRIGATENGPNRAAAQNYLISLGWLEKDKAPEQMHYRFVPLSVPELEAFKVGLEEFGKTGVAGLPYQPHGMDPKELDARPVKEVKPAEVNGWRAYIIPFKPHKGIALGKIDPKELQEFWANFSVRESVTGPDGEDVPYPAEIIDNQKAFRSALDLAGKELGFKEVE